MKGAKKIPVKFMAPRTYSLILNKPKPLPHLTSLPMEYLNKRVKKAFERVG